MSNINVTVPEQAAVVAATEQLKKGLLLRKCHVVKTPVMVIFNGVSIHGLSFSLFAVYYLRVLCSAVSLAVRAMGRLGYSMAGVGSVLAVFLTSCVSHGVGFVIPSAVRGCAAIGSWSGQAGVAGRGAVRTRAPTRALEVAAGGSKVDSSSVAEDDANRVAQIEGFTNKVCVM